MTDLVAVLSKEIEAWKKIEEYLATVQKNKREEQEDENDESAFNFEEICDYICDVLKVHHLI